jgi:3-deoxy-D-manno-octulosonic-acid transferase
LFHAGVNVAATWNKKAAQWVEGRKRLFQELEAKIAKKDRVIWIHCSSAGEFEQGKPLIEGLKKNYPKHKIVVSFFSPSGYSVARHYTYADVITYLPLDTRKQADDFIRIVHPELAVFVKYEFWYHHLAAAAFLHIPILLISATFRRKQLFFKRYGGFFRQMLFLFRHIFVQDEASCTLLKQHGINHVSISGDTRHDRVSKITQQPEKVEKIQEFIGDHYVVVAGSTWEGDEKLLAGFHRLHPKVKLILAPHEVNAAHISSIESLFVNSICYSAVQSLSPHQIANAQILIIDSVGLLSRLYQYATLAYVGGGFTKDGIHNTLEAAVWGKPVLFGANYKKYREAKELIEAGGGFSVRNTEELKKLAGELLSDEQYRRARNYVLENTGATEKILQEIQAKRLLTN